ncbi:HAD-IB family hydrolase [Thermodesulfobacteriota bacterium]
MNIALFDFDGTITTKDTLADFIQYVVGKPFYYMGLFILSPMLAAYTLKLIPNYIAKERLMIHFFKGWDEIRFQQFAEQYSLKEIDKITRPKSMEKIIWHQEQGHKIVVVSASMECWLKKWCAKYNIDLIATRLEIQDGKLTGKFATKNCYGIEKANRIKEVYDLSQFDYIYAYGDSPGDKEMLSIANERYYKHFD